MGGSDDPSNLVELTIEEHAEAHRLLYEKNGHWQDKVAWQGLLGLIPHEKIMEEMYAARKGKGNHMYGKPCYYKMSEEEKEQWKTNISKAGKGRKKPVGFAENLSKQNSGSGNPMYGKTPWNKGKLLGPQSAESRRKKGKPLVYNDVEYNSINEAETLTGISAYKISKNCTFISK
jgi:hypothetical protein